MAQLFTMPIMVASTKRNAAGCCAIFLPKSELAFPAFKSRKGNTVDSMHRAHVAHRRLTVHGFRTYCTTAQRVTIRVAWDPSSQFTAQFTDIGFINHQFTVSVVRSITGILMFISAVKPAHNPSLVPWVQQPMLILM